MLTEIRATLRLALPLIGAQLAQMSMGFVDTVMVGRLGPAPLAGSAIGSTLFFTAMLMGMGVIMAVGPMVAQAYGAGDDAGVGRAVRQGLWMAVILAIPFVILFQFTEGFLLFVGQPVEVAGLASGYLAAIAWGAPANLAFVACRGFVESLDRPRVVLVISLLGLGVNVLGNWVLMYGHWGAPALGLLGCGISSAIVMWVMFGAMAWYVRHERALVRYRPFAGLRRPDGETLRELFRIGWPIGITLGAESGLFAIAALMVGTMSTAALAAHQVALQCAAFTFMVPLGIGMASTVRVGQAVGRRDAAGARRAGWTGVALGAAFMCVTAVLFWAFPRFFIGLYLDAADPVNAEVIRVAVVLLGMAAIFQLVDGIQATAAGALRGLKDTRVPMLISLGTYWGLGLSTAAALAFGAGWGPVGVWTGLVAGLAGAAVALSWRFRARTRALAAEPAAA